MEIPVVRLVLVVSEDLSFKEKVYHTGGKDVGETHAKASTLTVT